MSEVKPSKGSESLQEFVRFLISVYKTSLGSDPNSFPYFFYETVKCAIKEVDPLFTAKSIVYFRHHVGMSSLITNIAAELTRNIVARSWGKYFYNSLVKNPMDMVCIIKILKRKNIPIPNAMKKGFTMAFDRFKESEIASSQNYDGEVNLIDVVNIVHPKHSDVIKKLIAGNIKVVEEEVDNYIDPETLLMLESRLEKDPKKLIDDICDITFK